ncbi:MAG: hypothetical protein CM15mV80_850 [uncultured marine virus]|nr:MAG: hypothetical protein CM15mV80_850 [uncultured marine virus]
MTDLYDRTASQLQSGLISFQGAQDKLQSYIDKYDLTAGFAPETRDTGVEDDPDTEIDESKEGLSILDIQTQIKELVNI